MERRFRGDGMQAGELGGREGGQPCCEWPLLRPYRALCNKVNRGRGKRQRKRQRLRTAAATAAEMFKTGEMLSGLWGKERDLMEDNCRQPISGPTPKSRTLRSIHTGKGQPISPVAGVFPREGAPRPAPCPSATLAALSIPLLSRTRRPPEIKGFPVLPAAPPRAQSLLRFGNARDSREKSFHPRWRLNSLTKRRLPA